MDANTFQQDAHSVERSEQPQQHRQKGATLPTKRESLVQTLTSAASVASTAVTTTVNMLQTPFTPSVSSIERDSDKDCDNKEERTLDGTAKEERGGRFETHADADDAEGTSAAFDADVDIHTAAYAYTDRPVPAPNALLPTFALHRRSLSSSSNDSELKVLVFLHPAHFAMLPPRLRAGTPVPVVPALFSQGVNEQQTVGILNKTSEVDTRWVALSAG